MGQEFYRGWKINKKSKKTTVDEIKLTIMKGSFHISNFYIFSHDLVSFQILLNSSNLPNCNLACFPNPRHVSKSWTCLILLSTLNLVFTWDMCWSALRSGAMLIFRSAEATLYFMLPWKRYLLQSHGFGNCYQSYKLLSNKRRHLSKYWWIMTI